MPSSKYYDDLADSYQLTANEDKSLGGLEFSLGENDLKSGDWSDALTCFGKGAQFYSDAELSEALASLYRSLATALRAAGK